MNLLRYPYLWLDVATLAFPLLLSFDRRVAFWRQWRSLVWPWLAGAGFFMVWDHYFTLWGVWSFNPHYLLGITLWGLPLEEWLFFLVVPYATLFVYACLQGYLPSPKWRPSLVRWVTWGLIGLLVLVGLTCLSRWYTSATCLLTAAVLALHLLWRGQALLPSIYLAWAVNLVPFFIVNGILTALPVVVYNNSRNLGIRLSTIPVEDTAYGFLLFLIIVTLRHRHPTPMPDLRQRSTLPELMDDPAAAPEAVRQSLRELQQINTLLGGYAVVLRALTQLKRAGMLQDGYLVMDLGCGGGDVLRRVAQWARANNLKLRLVGVDWNPLMISYCQEQAGQYPEINFVRADVWGKELDAYAAQVVMSSLFCHHFDADKLPALLARMAALASQAVVVNDLHRHWFAYHSIKWITALFSRSPLVRYDAALSVARALRRKEWQAMLQQAGLSNYSLHWQWAWRWRIVVNTANSRSR